MQPDYYTLFYMYPGFSRGGAIHDGRREGTISR